MATNDIDFFHQTTLPRSPDTKSELLPIPDQIGPYKIDSLLCRGGMSLLYLGVHPKEKTPIVIKVLSPHFVKNQEMVNQFLKEAEVIALTDHPNIIKLHGQGSWEKGLYIAMEFVQGVSLRQFILQNSLSLQRSLEILLQVAYALLHLHTNGVIHRDLKPENILITESGGIKVIDFGIAQLLHDKSQKVKFVKGGLIGTPSYMSPEQKKNPLEVNFGSDIYSLGVITYELIVGKLSCGNLQIDMLPVEVKTLVEKATAQNPKNRYSDVVDYITDLSECIKNLSSLSPSQATSSNEFWKDIESSFSAILPQSIPKWKDLEIGLATSKAPFTLDLYYEFFKLSDNNYLVLLAETESNNIDSMAHLSFLKGIVHSLLYPHLHSTQTLFSLGDFVSKVNEILCENKMQVKCAFNALLLDEQLDQFSLISCGFHSLWHLAVDNSIPHILPSEETLLGSNQFHEFSEVKDTWSEGDALLMHSFNSKTSNCEVKNIDALLKENFLETYDLSTQHQSDDLLDILMNEAKLEDQHSHIVMNIERIS